MGRDLLHRQAQLPIKVTNGCLLLGIFCTIFPAFTATGKMAGIFCFVFLKQGLAMKLRLALNSQSFCLSLQVPGLQDCDTMPSHDWKF
jgi:hypothetical protein